MILRSLGYKTDLFIHEYENRIEDRGHYILVETPSNPSFFWGNFLIFDGPPGEGDLLKWQKLFSTEFAHQPLVRHCTLAWDSTTGERGSAEEFVRAGFSLEESVVLTTKSVTQPPKVNSFLEVRPLQTDKEWEEATQNQLECRLADFNLEMYEPYKRNQMARYRRMAEAGLGHWYGGFLDGRLVGELGIFVKDGIGRFQAVGTNPQFRRQGVCGTLVWKSALHALKESKADTLVMVADENYHAAQIYESVGFRPTERQIGVYRWPKDKWS